MDEKDIRKIRFGCSDAHTEGLDYPELLRHGYFDFENVVDKALHSGTFLFLGYKGSGKSSLSEHLRLTSNDSIFVDIQRLTNFSFSSFNKIIKSDTEKEIKAQETWRWILCVKVLQNLIKDKDAHADNEGMVNKAIDLLTQSGMFPLMTVSSLVSHSSTTKFKASLSSFGIEHKINSENIPLSITLATNFLKDLIASYKESHEHFIIIDDIDDILHPNGTQYNIIAALINEVQDLNRYFKQKGVPIKILIMCRTDVFDRLRDPNKNKIKQDSSYCFWWYKEGIDKPNSNPLVKLINIRARLVFPDIDNIFDELFPQRYDKTSIYNALLDFTRHTPRDFVELINFIQKQCEDKSVTSKDIKEGLKEYSMEYFIQEIRDEMTGYIPSEDSELILSCISSLHNREFRFEEIEKIYLGRNVKAKREDLIEIMQVLYDCSAIGHKYSYKGERRQRVTFKYRNRNSTFNEKEIIFLHKGLWKALNVNY